MKELSKYMAFWMLIHVLYIELFVKCLPFRDVVRAFY